MKAVLLTGIRGYQYLLRPLLGNHCRFAPSCSDYAREAVEKHGALTGTWLAFKHEGFVAIADRYALDRLQAWAKLP